MGHIYEWMEDEIWDFARDKGVQFDHIEFPGMEILTGILQVLQDKILWRY